MTGGHAESGEAHTVPVMDGGSPSAAQQPGSEPLAFICESCGADKPVEKVYQCQLCMLNYCVNHLAPMAHYCFGALGKPQTIGVTG